MATWDALGTLPKGAGDLALDALGTPASCLAAPRSPGKMGFTAVGSIMGFHLASRGYSLSLTFGGAAREACHRKAIHIKSSASSEDLSSSRALGAPHRQAQQS